ncbi:MAG: DUF4160 domain-containing protein [Methylococcaceae bacterium]
MGKIYTGNGWLIKVHGNEHPPIHVHVLHPNGKAAIALDGEVHNTGVPIKVIAEAIVWITANSGIVEAEWEKMNNPRKR